MKCSTLFPISVLSPWVTPAFPLQMQLEKLQWGKTPVGISVGNGVRQGSRGPWTQPCLDTGPGSPLPQGVVTSGMRLTFSLLCLSFYSCTIRIVTGPPRWAVVRTLKMVFVKCSVEVGQRFGCRPLKQQAFSTHPCGARNGPSLRGPSLWLPLCFTSALSGRIVGGLGPPQKCLPGTALGSGGQPGANSWSSTSTLPAAGRSCVRSSGLSPQRRWCKHQASTANLDELGTSPWAGSLRSG